MYQYIERFRNTWPWNIISFHNCFISFCSSDNIIRFKCQQLLENIRCSVSFQCPHFHFTKSLSTKLCLTTKRLLSNQTVWPDRTSMHLVIHHVVQLNNVDDSNGSLLIETLTGFSIV